VDKWKIRRCDHATKNVHWSTSGIQPYDFGIYNYDASVVVGYGVL
jgi:hypothetical protein